jgi:hypothetical protein
MNEGIAKDVSCWVYFVTVGAGLSDEFEWDSTDGVNVGSDLESRDAIEKAWSSLDATQREKVAAADRLAVEHASVLFARVKSALDVDAQRSGVPLRRWWWLDKVASGELEPASRTVGSYLQVRPR